MDAGWPSPHSAGLTQAVSLVWASVSTCEMGTSQETCFVCADGVTSCDQITAPGPARGSQGLLWPQALTWGQGCRCDSHSPPWAAGGGLSDLFWKRACARAAGPAPGRWHTAGRWSLGSGMWGGRSSRPHVAALAADVPRPLREVSQPAVRTPARLLASALGCAGGATCPQGAGLCRPQARVPAAEAEQGHERGGAGGPREAEQ